ncbi:glycosyltransferase [Pseudoalteromonas sp. YIC-656]|uniref:glycosyltransferase n=1 Tax=Pseudoalteromonas pernae TaxID=3118054 RepID=UPI0032426F70
MHILVVPSNYPNAAQPNAAPFFRDQVDLLLQRGHDVGVLSIVPLQFKNWLRAGLVKQPQHIQLLFPAIPKLSALTSWVRFQISKYLIKRYIKCFGKPEVIHVHAYMAGEVAIWAKKKLGIPYVITEHYSHFYQSNSEAWRLKLAKKVYQQASKRIAVSSPFKLSLENSFQEPFEVIGNLIDPNFENEKVAETPPKEFFILNVARLVPIKNHELLLRSFKLAHSEKPELKLEIIGAGPELSKLQTLASKLDIADNIIFHGECNKEFIKARMKDALATVLTSDYETFGVVLVESLSVGTPVVTTNVGGTSDIVSSEQLGYLCQADEGEVAGAIIDLIENPKDSRLIKEIIVTKFGKNRFYERMRKAYEDAIGIRDL